MTNEAHTTPSAVRTWPQRGARADSVLRVLAIIGLIGVATQFLLAGAGAFGEGFSNHVYLGRFLAVWALALLVTVLIARAGRADVLTAVGLLLIALGQSGFAILSQEVSGWFGMLHVLGGAAYGGLTHQLMAGAKRRQQLRQQAG